MRPMGLSVYQAYKESQHINQQLDTLVIDILDVHVLQRFFKNRLLNLDFESGNV